MALTKEALPTFPNSCDQHDEVTDAIERGDFEAAAGYVENHWRKGTKIVLDWIEQRKTDEVKKT